MWFGITTSHKWHNNFVIDIIEQYGTDFCIGVEKENVFNVSDDSVKKSKSNCKYK